MLDHSCLGPLIRLKSNSGWPEVMWRLARAGCTSCSPTHSTYLGVESGGELDDQLWLPNRGLQTWPLHVIWVSPITVTKFWEWEPEGQGRKEGTYTNRIHSYTHTFIIGSLCSALVGVFPQCKNAQDSFYGTIVSLPYHQIHFYSLSPTSFHPFPPTPCFEYWTTSYH